MMWILKEESSIQERDGGVPQSPSWKGPYDPVVLLESETRFVTYGI
jgi:hypothetical protein